MNIITKEDKDMKKSVVLLLGLAMAASLLAGCGSKPAEAQKNQAAADSTAAGKAEDGGAGTEAADGGETSGGGLKVALCVTGAVNDMGWCQSAYDGLKLVEQDLGCEVAYTENLDAADMVATFTDYAANGYDVIIGHGFQFGDPALEVGELYPDVKFICIEAEASAANVASYVMKCEETGYLEGMLAASMSQSGKLGFIGPVQGASLVKIMNAYEDGAKEVNPQIEVQTAWTGSFTDTALAKEAATAMIENGVDVLGHCANESGTGALNAATDAGIYTTGDSYDQYDLAPKAVLTSAIYNVPQLIKTAVSDIMDGRFEGAVKQLGMAEGIVELAPYHDLESAIPEDVKKLIEDRKAAIISGEFVVPCDTTARN